MVSAGLASAVAILAVLPARPVAVPEHSSFTRAEPAPCGSAARGELRFVLLEPDAEPVVPAGAGPPVCLAVYRVLEPWAP